MAMRGFGGVVAGAIEATMSAAHAATPRESLAKVLPRAMQPHGDIILGKAEFGGDFGRLLALKVNLLNKVAILFRHHGQQPFKTLAENALVLIRWHFRKFLLESFQGPAPSPLASVDIDDGASQNPVEPLRRRLFTFWLSIGRECFNKAFLHDVLGQVLVAKAIARECYKHVQVADQRIGKLRHWGRLRLVLSGGNSTVRISELAR